MLRISEEQYALGALTLFALWLFVGLPIVYSSDGGHSTDWWLAAFTGAVAFFTLFLVIANVGLYRAGGRQLAHLDDTAKRQLRAYVTARDLSLTLHRHPAQMGAHGPIEGRVHTYGFSAILQNGGQTPATNVAVNVRCERLRRSLLADFNFPDGDLFGHGVIGPRGEMHSPVIRIRENELEAIEPEFGWYLWGWVEYDDIFSDTNRHRTELCFEIDRVRLTPTNELVIGFRPHPRFNAVDSNCLRLPVRAR